MKALLALRKPVLGLLVVLALLTGARLAWSATCEDVASRGHLNIMTINLLFSEVQTREKRLRRIADFAVAESSRGNPVDVFLLQEVTGGALVGTANSAQDLQNVLRARGQAMGLDLNYELRSAFETGIPGILATANAVLSRCDIRLKLARFLPLTSESVKLGGLVIPITRNVMMVRLKIPGFGRINVYNTHLCSDGCALDELGQQLQAVLGFVDKTESIFSFRGRRPLVMGGDLNIDILRAARNPETAPFGPEKRLYDNIIGAGFIDAYAEVATQAPDVALIDLCADENHADKHCTVGASELNGSKAQRIDYLFVQRFQAVNSAAVLFNPLAEGGMGPTVSDHSAVLVKVNL